MTWPWWLFLTENFLQAKDAGECDAKRDGELMDCPQRSTQIVGGDLTEEHGR